MSGLRFLRKITWLIVFGSGLFSGTIHAQDTDYTTWIKMGVQYSINSQLDLSTGLEWRTKDHLQCTDRLGVDITAKYELLPFLKLGAGYEVHYRDQKEDGWKFRQRYHADGTLSTKWIRLKLALRERFQHTWDKEETELRLRSRLKLAYDIRHSKVEPYVSIEMYNGLKKGEKFDVMRIRYRGGLTLPLFSDKWEADIFYCRQWEHNNRKNIFGVDCVYKF